MKFRYFFVDELNILKKNIEFKLDFFDILKDVLFV